MSLLKTNLEDLLVARTNDARKIAKSTLSHDTDDLVSDPDRKDNDDKAQNNIDKALSTGHVYQDSGESVFSSLEEQQAYINYTALKTITNPISGEPQFDDLSLFNICRECSNLSEFTNRLYKESKSLSYKKRKQFDERVIKLEDSIAGQTPEDLILWKSIVSELKK